MAGNRVLAIVPDGIGGRDAGSLGRIGGGDLPLLLRGLFGKTDKARE
jgi:hypothetical protein